MTKRCQVANQVNNGALAEIRRATGRIRSAARAETEGIAAGALAASAMRFIRPLRCLILRYCPTGGSSAGMR